MPQSEYNAVIRDPNFQRALERYKSTVEPALAQSHSENEGVFSNALGPLDTYVPLTALDEEGKQVHRTSRGRELDTPENLHNNFATGQSAKYDATPDTVRQRSGNMLRRNAQAYFIRQAEGDGLILKPDDPRVHRAPDGKLTMTVKGKDVPAVEETIGEPVRIINDGNSFHVPSKVRVLPADLAHELGPIVTKPDRTFGLHRRQFLLP